jgi:hypothetical protein
MLHSITVEFVYSTGSNVDAHRLARSSIHETVDRHVGHLYPSKVFVTLTVYS